MSDTNNNIPTRITQLEEATEYEDGMFYAVAKAGRGTYKIPVDEMTPNEQALSDKMENEIVPAVENSFAYGTVENQSIATFTDGSALPMPKLEVAIEPIQEGSGDPSPTNIRPISGWSAVDVTDCGVNVWDEEWELDANYRLSSKNYIPVKPDTEYIFCNTYLYSITGYDKDKNSISGISLRQIQNVGYKFTTPSNCYFIKFKIGNSYGTTYNHDISINYPSTDTSYHAYNGHTYTIDLDGTRYGGKLDVVSGVLTVEKGYADLGSLTWTRGVTGVTGRYRFITQSLRSTAIATPSNVVADLKASIFIAVKGDTGWASDVDNVIWCDNYKDISVVDESYTDATEFKTAMDGVQLVYKLATPITIQLTPTQVSSLMGVNNISANTGKILKVEYIRDLDIVINSLLERIAALEG